jgi:hypothetical protein
MQLAERGKEAFPAGLTLWDGWKYLLASLGQYIKD